MTDSLIQIRLDSKLKKNAENVLFAMGIKTTEAVRMFLQQVINDQALPFHPHVGTKANKNTINSFKEVKKGRYIDSTLAEFRKSLKAKK